MVLGKAPWWMGQTEWTSFLTQGDRDAAKEHQLASGKADQGERAGVTSGKNMDGFLSLIIDVVNFNGISQADIHMNQAMLTLPGFFRSTNLWNLLVLHRGELIAAVELRAKSDPSVTTLTTKQKKQ